MSESLITDEMRESVRRTLVEHGCGQGSSLHSWRCDKPDIYGPCNCVGEVTTDILVALAPLIAAAALREAAQVWGEGEWLEAFSALPVEDDLSAVQANVQWLRDRADTYEKETP